jgi:hypothetical protein
MQHHEQMNLYKKRKSTKAREKIFSKGVIIVNKDEKDPMFQSGEMTDQLYKGLYGMEPEMSLLSVNFATAENPFLNEHDQNDPKDKEDEHI